MKNSAIFLDRDGTINKDGDHPHRLVDLHLIPSAILGLRLLRTLGVPLIIVTNQAGIGQGLYTEKDYFAFRSTFYKELSKKNIEIDAEYFCPHHPTKGIGKYGIDCGCRKPKAGMLEKAAKEFSLDLTKCWMIGDKLSDIQAGNSVGCRTIHVLTGKYKESTSEAEFEAEDLIKAAIYIIKTNKINFKKQGS